jgi:hypothetical protein
MVCSKSTGDWMKVGEEIWTPPRPPKPDGRISRIRLSGPRLPMGWLRHSSQGVQKQRTSRASSRSAHPFQGGPLVTGRLLPSEYSLHRCAQPCGTTSALAGGAAWQLPPRSYVPSLHARYPLLGYYGRADPDRPFRRRRPWFPDSRRSDFQPCCPQPSAVLCRTRSTPSAPTALFHSWLSPFG